MEDFGLRIAGLCAFDVKDEPIMRAFSALGKGTAAESAEAYSEICRLLLVSGKTLCDYLYDALVYSGSALLTECAKEPTELRRKAVECDLRIIAKICEYTSERLKIALSDEYGTRAFMSLPDYEKGSFDHTAEGFIEFARKNGSGLFAKYRAFRWAEGGLHPVENTDPIRLSDLKNYEAQRSQVIDNTVCFLNGKPAQNVLLYGDRGTGKSSTVKAILNEYEGLRMIELSKNDVAALPKLFRELKDIPLHFIITIDDLTFAENDDRFGILKAALEGSLSARPDNILIYATTNRRKIVKETVADREINGADSIDESMSLADRFGLFITFVKPNREGYLDIVKKIAADRSINIPEDRLCAAADRFSVKRGGYSPRIARQFVDWLEGRVELGLDY